MSTFLKDRIDSRGVKEGSYVKLEEPPLPSPLSFTTVYTSIRVSLGLLMSFASCELEVRINTRDSTGNLLDERFFKS